MCNVCGQNGSALYRRYWPFLAVPRSSGGRRVRSAGHGRSVSVLTLRFSPSPGPQAGGGFGQPATGGLFGATASSAGSTVFGATQSKPLFGAAPSELPWAGMGTCDTSTLRSYRIIHSIKIFGESGWITPPNATFIFILKNTKTIFCHHQETKLATAYCTQYCLVVIAAFGICLSLE